MVLNAASCLARSSRLSDQDAAAQKGVAVMTCADPRWARCDIKTVMLLPASIAKEKAKAQGAQEAWFIDNDGQVLEGGLLPRHLPGDVGAVADHPVAGDGGDQDDPATHDDRLRPRSGP